MLAAAWQHPPPGSDSDRLSAPLAAQKGCRGWLYRPATPNRLQNKAYFAAAQGISAIGRGVPPSSREVSHLDSGVRFWTGDAGSGSVNLAVLSHRATPGVVGDDEIAWLQRELPGPTAFSANLGVSVPHWGRKGYDVAERFYHRRPER